MARRLPGSRRRRYVSRRRRWHPATCLALSRRRYVSRRRRWHPATCPVHSCWSVHKAAPPHLFTRRTSIPDHPFIVLYLFRASRLHSGGRHNRLRRRRAASGVADLRAKGRPARRLRARRLARAVLTLYSPRRRRATEPSSVRHLPYAEAALLGSCCVRETLPCMHAAAVSPYSRHVTSRSAPA